jgi:hypothetical protein
MTIDAFQMFRTESSASEDGVFCISKARRLVQRRKGIDLIKTQPIIHLNFFKVAWLLVHASHVADGQMSFCHCRIQSRTTEFQCEVLGNHR